MFDDTKALNELNRFRQRLGEFLLEYAKYTEDHNFPAREVLPIMLTGLSLAAARTASHMGVSDKDQLEAYGMTISQARRENAEVGLAVDIVRAMYEGGRE